MPNNFFVIFLIIAIFGVVLNLSMKIEELNDSNIEEFVLKLGKIFENSPWVVQEAYAERPFESVDQLFNAMNRIIMNAGRDKQLKLIRAHPDLAGNEMISGNLTQLSTSEQTNAGLNALTKQQLATFNSLNSAYKSRFNFPFIVSLREQGGINGILVAFRCRMINTEEQEITEALTQIGRIARHRLDALMEQE